MKKLLGLVLLIFVMVFATSSSTTPDPPMHSLQGTWELQSFYNYEDEEVSDTVPTAEGYRQVKMYYNGKVMWSRANPDKPSGRFGFGTYKITEDELEETIEYGDAEMMKALDTMRVFRFELVLGENNYSQITIDSEGHRTFSENYKRID